MCWQSRHVMFEHSHMRILGFVSKQIVHIMRELESLYEQFGIRHYHSNGIYGQGVRIMIIDTGCKPGGANVHGLAVASLLVSDKGAGICPKADLEMSDVRDPANIPIDLILSAIRRGIDEKFDIISISLGTGDAWDPLEKLIQEADSNGIFVFAASGNAGELGYEFPAACRGAISVASMNLARQPSAFNTRNDAVVLFAPGEKLKLPTGLNGALQEFTGTSFATPFAAGLAALILSEAKTKGQTFNRRKLIDKMRDYEHLGLNCDVHSYVLEKTCTNFPDPNPVSEKSDKLFLGIFFLIVLFVIGVIILKSK